MLHERDVEHVEDLDEEGKESQNKEECEASLANTRPDTACLTNSRQQRAIHANLSAEALALRVEEREWENYKVADSRDIEKHLPDAAQVGGGKSAVQVLSRHVVSQQRVNDCHGH